MFLVIGLLLTMGEMKVWAKDMQGEEKDKIIREYQEAILDLKLHSCSAAALDAEIDATILGVQADTVLALRQAGYEAYDVNPQTYTNVAEILETDLKDAGLNPEGAYIVVVEGEQNDSAIARTDSSDSFYHSYNGTLYKLRSLTVYASDDPLMGKASTVNVLSSTSTTVIQNCLDTVIGTYLGAIDKRLGTVASICGLSISNFAPAQQVTMYLNAGTNWTREYTQVWSDYDNMWGNGSFVEKVSAFSYMSGVYYDSNTNNFKKVNENKSYDTRYSSKYNDKQWKRDSAVQGILTSWTYKDTVGDMQYKYGGSVKITHRENF